MPPVKPQQLLIFKPLITMKTTKKITLIATAAIGLLCTKQSFGQWTYSSPNEYFNNSGGSVGIGLTSPQNLLDVSSGSRSGTHPTGLALYVTGSLGSESGIRFAHDNATQGINFGYEGISKYTSNGSNDFYMDAASSGNLLFQTIATGNVGIGTTSPAVKLDVSGANSAGEIAVFRNGSTNSFITANSGGYDYNPLTQSGDHGLFWTDGSGTGGMNSSSGFVLAPWSSNGYGLRLDGSSGNATFTSGATIATLTIGNATSAALGYGTSYCGFNASRSSSGTWTCLSNSVNNAGNVVYGDLSGNMRFVTIPNSSSPGSSQTLSDATLTNNTIMMITGAGKVVIGNPFASSGAVTTNNVTTPGTYTFYCAGGILTDQVKVATVNGSNWSDYVFADNYKLKPLNEVAQYIQQNKHLPEVPSACDVEKDGVDMVSMDATLLKKIEELTLYMIQQQQQIKELQDKVASMSNKGKE